MQALINAIIVAALESYSDRLGNDGCNDVHLPNTPDNLALVKAAQAQVEEDMEINLSDDEKTIYTSNIDLVDYVTNQFKEQNKVDEKLVKQLVKALS